MRRYLKYGLILLFLCLFNNNVYAIEIDPARIGSLVIENSYSNLKLSDTKIEIYRVALVDKNLKYYYLDNFVDAQQKDLTGITDNKELVNIAKKLSEFIDQEKITATSFLKTNQDGKIKFSNLTTGVYLIRTESKTIDKYNYYSNPVLVSLPFFDELYSDYLYDVKIKIKTEKEEVINPVDPDNPDVNYPTDDPNKNPDNESVPNTFDKIYWFIGIFVVSLIITLSILVYIYRVYKKKK